MDDIRETQQVYIEYRNLPMRTAFQNEKLAAQVKDLLAARGFDFRKLQFADRTFRQLVCLDAGTGLTEGQCGAICRLMDAQDRENPFPIKRAYPSLQEEHWSVNMSSVSYIKVQICITRERSFCVQRIEKHAQMAQEGSVLFFIPYDMDEAGMSYLRVKTGSEAQMLSMMKDILLKGALDLSDYKLLEIEPK